MVPSNGWVPGSVGVLLCGLLIAVVVSHLVHATRQRPLPRRWHAFHILMALGMLDMLPDGSMPVPPSVLVVVFGAATLGAVGVAGVTHLAGTGPAWMWLLTAADLAAMVLMALLMSAPTGTPSQLLAWTLVTLPFVAWLVTESMLWLTGLLLVPAQHLGAVEPTHDDWLTPRQAPYSQLQPEPRRRDAVRQAGTAATSALVAPARVTASRREADGVWLRGSLAAMTLVMAFTLLATLYGAADAPQPDFGSPASSHSMPFHN